MGPLVAAVTQGRVFGGKPRVPGEQLRSRRLNQQGVTAIQLPSSMNRQILALFLIVSVSMARPALADDRIYRVGAAYEAARGALPSPPAV